MVGISLQGGSGSRIKIEKLILPGEKIGVIEEFLLGNGTYEEEGTIRSLALGDARIDLEKKVAEVVPRTKPLVYPKEGSKVVGEVEQVKRPMASIDIFRVDDHFISVSFTGILHFSSMSREYTRHMALAVRESDIVEAKVINMKNRIIQLSIQEPEYGVIYAFCSKCGSLLELKRTRLICPNCGRMERRKVSTRYGTEML
jgi:exosome complex component CSL4